MTKESFKRKIKLIAIVSSLGLAGVVAGLTLGTSQTQENISSAAILKVENESSRTFDGGNFCTSTITEIDCSSIFDDSFIENKEINAKPVKYQYLISFNQDILLHDITFINPNSPTGTANLPSVADGTQEVHDILLPKISTQNSNGVLTQVETKDFLQKFFVSENTGDSSILIKANQAIIISSKTNKVFPKTFQFTLSARLNNGANRNVNMTTTTIPYVKSVNLNEYIQDLAENNDKRTKLTKTQSVRLNTSTNTDINIKPLLSDQDGKLKINTFNKDFVKGAHDVEAMKIIESYWNSFLGTPYSNGKILKTRQVDQLLFKGVNMEHMAKDFLLLNNVRSLVFRNSFNFGLSNITEAEWDGFFASNPNLNNIEISSSQLTNESFETLRKSIEKINRPLSLSLANNELKTLPAFNNDERITSLDLTGNALINISSLDAEWTTLKTLNLSYNYDLAKENPTFLVNVNALTALQSLNLEGLGIGKHPLTITNLSTPSTYSELKGRIETLNLSNNGLTSVDDIFTSSSNFNSIKHLDLSNNELESIGENFSLLGTNDINLDLSDNTNLDFQVPDSTTDTSSLSLIEELNLSNVKSITLPTAFSNSTSLKSLKLGKIGSSLYASLENLPSSITSLSINDSNWLNSVSIGTVFTNLNALKNVDLSSNGLLTFALTALKGKTTIESLNISKNEISSFRSVTESLGLTSLKKIQATNLVNLDLNGLLGTLGGNNLVEVDLSGSSVQIYERNDDIVPFTPTGRVKIFLNSLNSFKVTPNDVFTNSSVKNILNSNIDYLLKYNEQNFNLSIKSAILNSLEQAANTKLELQFLSLPEEESRAIAEGNANIELEIKMPTLKKENIENNFSYPIYLNMVNNEIDSKNQAFNLNLGKFLTINDLKKNQEEIQKKVKDFAENNSRLLKNLQELESGSLQTIIISLLSLVVVINAVLLSIFLIRRKKKKQ